MCKLYLGSNIGTVPGQPFPEKLESASVTKVLAGGVNAGATESKAN